MKTFVSDGGYVRCTQASTLTTGSITTGLTRLLAKNPEAAALANLLDLTFTQSPSSYAFVNAIEVISIPDKLYIKGDGNENSVLMVGQDTRFSIDDSYALEKLYRLNVGGGDISSTHDSGMFRSWDNDEPYLLGADRNSNQVHIDHSSLHSPRRCVLHCTNYGR
ncbi:hypothetical protein POM88_053309 [Heracleum sosnowskyi]|uniref:Uncharacterized protein n=1 Tax=Heracleum sosnowskyi TaxID=360622 RepID=A0AAD8GP06_9APIA|nr:hypothetical protein POM88_053309 [Heracleum sosnowskyi]